MPVYFTNFSEYNSFMRVTFLSVQPCTKYFAWQVEVMLTNFREIGIHKEHDIHCLFAVQNNEEGVTLMKIVEAKMKGVARFFYYDDTRTDTYYSPSVRPHILKKHFKVNPYNGYVFYHDCDMVFTKFPDFLDFLPEDDNTWYVSNTKSYIAHSYIIKKGEDVLAKMCEIIGINPILVEKKEEESGGAQYILTGLDWRFFDKMEQDCSNLFLKLTELNVNKKNLSPDYSPLQIWCADMWALLWGAWMRGFKTKIIKEMDFCVGTDRAERWHQVYIYHNAAIIKSRADKYFYKSDFENKLPYGESGDGYLRHTASFKYFRMMKSVKSCLVDDFLEIDFIKRAHQRFLICKTCEFFSRKGASIMCKKCGAITKNRIMQEENNCPENLWTV